MLSHSVTSEGRLLSFQSIVCKIPDLPIHDAKITSFYIPGEGVDKTKTLMRISINYGINNPRSSALDFTIFDSLCWGCPNGPLSCQPNPTPSCNVLSEPFGVGSDPFQSTSSFSNPTQLLFHNQNAHPLQYSPASFSSGPSYQSSLALQPHSPHPGLTSTGIRNPCLLTHDGGPCKNDILRYYFDSTARRCRKFIYGGCLGNENNFLTEMDCLRACNSQAVNAADNSSFAASVAVAKVEPLSTHRLVSEEEIPEECFASNDPGESNCAMGELIKYFYDSYMKKCRPFVYTGCGGNRNNFVTLDECMEECGLAR